MMTELRFPIVTDGDIVSARQAGKEMAQTLGFSTAEATMIATAISEVARNIVLYAGTGEVILAEERENGRHGVRVVASDTGPGITDVDRAMEDGYSSGRGLGLGLPGARRLMDDFALTTVLGEGTSVSMIKWSAR